MLQNLRESTGRWAAAGILGFIAITFIFFGNFDFGFTGTTFAAKVNGEDIPLLEFEREYQRAQNQYQQLYPVELTDDLRRELRRSVVERMALGRALEQRARETGYRISDERLSESIRATEAFQAGGQFSPDSYRLRLAAQGLTPPGYEALHRRELEVLELQEGIASSTFWTPAEFRRYIEIFNERRELAYALFTADGFLAEVEISDADVAAHYAANGALYMSPETVDLEYIELDQAAIAATVTVTDRALEEYFNEQRERFQTAEERRARHILVTVEGDDTAAAEAEAAAIRARVDAGEDFAALATELSDDPGTKAQGGDLGWIARDQLAGPFEDALFALSAGEVAGPVQTDFGYHVIKLDEVRAGAAPTLAEVRDELAAEYQTREAEDLFYEQANRLEELAFDAYDELASVATALGVPLETVTGYPRSGNPELFANNAAVVQSAFDEELVASGNNSRLIELADDRVMVLCVTAHHPPVPLPLESVAEEIREELARAAAEELANAAATAFLADLDAPVGASSARDLPAVGAASARDSPAVGASSARDLQSAAEARGGTWYASRSVERTDAQVPTETLAAAFAVRPPLPAGGIRQVVPMASGDTTVFLLTAVMPGDPATVPLEQRDRQQVELANEAALSEMTGYAADVRDRATIRIPDEVLNPQF